MPVDVQFSIRPIDLRLTAVVSNQSVRSGVRRDFEPECRNCSIACAASGEMFIRIRYTDRSQIYDIDTLLEKLREGPRNDTRP